jgi:hypothetical protein
MPERLKWHCRKCFTGDCSETGDLLKEITHQIEDLPKRDDIFDGIISSFGLDRSLTFLSAFKLHMYSNASPAQRFEPRICGLLTFIHSGTYF